MEENNRILSEQIPFAIQKTEQGIGKTRLNVRLASDMDEDFLERLKKFCSLDREHSSNFPPFR